MKAIFALFAVGSILAAVYAAPTKTDKALANLFEDSTKNAEMQFNWGGFIKDVAPHVIDHFTGGREDVQAQKFLANLEKVAREQQDVGDDSKNAEMQFWGTLLGALAPHLIKTVTGGHENIQAQGKVALEQQNYDDDNKNAEMQFNWGGFLSDVAPHLINHFAGGGHEDVQAQEFLANLKKAARGQQGVGDDSKNAEMQFWGTLFGALAPHLIKTVTGGRSSIQAQEKVAREQQDYDDDNKNAEMQFNWGGFLSDVAPHLINHFAGGHEDVQAQEAVAQQSDDDGSLAEAQLIKDLVKGYTGGLWKAKAQQSDDDGGMSVDDRLVQRLLEKLDTAASEQSNDIMASLEGLPEEVRSQWLSLLPLAGSLLHHLG